LSKIDYNAKKGLDCVKLSLARRIIWKDTLSFFLIKIKTLASAFEISNAWPFCDRATWQLPAA